MLFAIARLVLDSTAPDLQHREQALHRLHELKDQGTGHSYWIAQLCKNVGDGFYNREEWDRAIQAYRNALAFDFARIDTRIRLSWVLIMIMGLGKRRDDIPVVQVIGRIDLCGFCPDKKAIRDITRLLLKALSVKPVSIDESIALGMSLCGLTLQAQRKKPDTQERIERLHQSYRV